MRYRIVGALTMASIVLGSLAALNWALHGALALAWAAFAFGVLGVVVLIACLGLYMARDDEDDARQEHPWAAPSPAQHPWAAPSPAPKPRDRAQDRAWLREPHTIAGVRPAGPAAPMSRPSREGDTSERTKAL